MSADDARVKTYLAASGALGAITLWGSEMLFWSAPRGPVSVVELALTWLAYAVCSAAALSMVLVTGVQGWRAVFLGGAVLGWTVEGVVVATMYDAFPFQVVWTPLAWHALVTGLVVVGAGRVAGRWPLWRRVATWLVVGVVAGLWASWWPIERGAMPSLGATAAYLVGLGLLVPVGHLVLDRVGHVAVPSRPVLLMAPVILGVGWLVRFVLAPTPLYLVLPVLLALTWWLMRRWSDEAPRPGLALGGGSGGGVGAGVRAQAPFLIAPVVGSLLASQLWRGVPEGLPFHIVVALASIAVSLWLFGRLVLGARRRVAVSV